MIALIQRWLCALRYRGLMSGGQLVTLLVSRRPLRVGPDTATRVARAEVGAALALARLERAGWIRPARFLETPFEEPAHPTWHTLWAPGPASDMRRFARITNAVRERNERQRGYHGAWTEEV